MMSSTELRRLYMSPRANCPYFPPWHGSIERDPCSTPSTPIGLEGSLSIRLSEFPEAGTALSDAFSTRPSDPRRRSSCNSLERS
jgi:hypothetical protein